eukprot:TRINITY_DN978_c0_g1_i4.p1 TRINITY_DN978_c0_g1~~TRINITY_DN978_c0_g1_i4.p1  ORF type:complete len:2281 (+),score=591.71 TRINITY_DN978_c0_g1_i4:169-6843(+)
MCYACGEEMDEVAICPMTGLAHKRDEEDSESDDGPEPVVVGPWERIRNRVPRAKRDWKKEVKKDAEGEWKEKLKKQMDRKGLPPLRPPPKAKPDPKLEDDTSQGTRSEPDESFPQSFSLSTNAEGDATECDAEPSISEISVEISNPNMPTVVLPPPLELPPLELPPPATFIEHIDFSPPTRQRPRSLSPIPTLKPRPRTPPSPAEEDLPIKVADLMNKAADVRDASAIIIPSLIDSPNPRRCASPEPVVFVERGSLVRKDAMEWLLDRKCVTVGDSYSESNSSGSPCPLSHSPSPCENTDETPKADEAQTPETIPEPQRPQETAPPAVVSPTPSPWVDLSRLLVNVSYDGGARDREASYSRRERVVQQLMQRDGPQDEQASDIAGGVDVEEQSPKPKTPEVTAVPEKRSPSRSVSESRDACVGTSPSEEALVPFEPEPAPEEVATPQRALQNVGSFSYLAVGAAEEPLPRLAITDTLPLRPYSPPELQPQSKTWDYMPVRSQNIYGIIEEPKPVVPKSKVSVSSLPVPAKYPIVASSLATASMTAPTPAVPKGTDPVHYLPIKRKPPSALRASPPADGSVDESVWQYEAVPMTPSPRDVKQPVQSSPVGEEGLVPKAGAYDVKRPSMVSHTTSVETPECTNDRRARTLTPFSEVSMPHSLPSVVPMKFPPKTSADQRSDVSGGGSSRGEGVQRVPTARSINVYRSNSSVKKVAEMRSPGEQSFSFNATFETTVGSTEGTVKDEAASSKGSEPVSGDDEKVGMKEEIAKEPEPCVSTQHAEEDDDEAEEDCPACGYSISMADTCPETGLPHARRALTTTSDAALHDDASHELNTTAKHISKSDKEPEEDELCAKCGFYIAFTEICSVTKLPHILAQETPRAQPKEVSADADEEEDEEEEDCPVCGYTISMVDRCPETGLLHVKRDSEPSNASVHLDTTKNHEESTRTSLAHTAEEDEELPHTSSTPAAKEEPTSQPPAPEQPEPMAATPKDEEDEDDLCMKCGFYTALTPICYVTKEPHKSSAAAKDDTRVSEPEAKPEPAPSDKGAQEGDEDELCMKCGFYIAMTPICYVTKEPHTHGAGAAKEAVVEEEPVPKSAAREDEDEEDEEDCPACGFSISMVDTCPKTGLPHVASQAGVGAGEGGVSEPVKTAEPEEDDLCMKCGFYTALTEICYVTKLPHKPVPQEATQPEGQRAGQDEKEGACVEERVPGSATCEDADEDEEAEEDCPACGFSISMVDTCPETGLPHAKPSQPSATTSERKDGPGSEGSKEDSDRDPPSPTGGQGPPSSGANDENPERDEPSDTKEGSVDNEASVTEFGMGDKVLAHGLTKHPLINGTCGRIIGFQKSKGSTLVQVEFPAGCVAVRGTHLSIVDEKEQAERLHIRRQSSTPPVLPGMAVGLRRVTMAQAPDAGVSIASAIKEWERSTVHTPNEQPLPSKDEFKESSSDEDVTEDGLLLLKVMALTEKHEAPWTLASKKQVAKKLTRFRATIRAVAGGWAVCQLKDGFVTGKGMYYTIATSEPTMPPGYKILCRKAESVKEERALSVPPAVANLPKKPKEDADSGKRSVFRERGQSIMATGEGDDSMFAVGRHVIAEGLRKAPHINKQRGKVLGKQKQPGGEILIQVDFSGSCMAVREANLRPVCCNEVCGNFPSTKCGKCKLGYCSSCTCPCTIDHDARPVDWVKDEASTVCSGCGEGFSLVKRRHHCRACGHLFCATCVRTRQILPGFDTPQKVCQTCTVDIAPSSSNWLPDSEANECGLCWGAFTTKKRRHHCRACGKIFCDQCSSQRMRVHGYVIPQRVCIRCASAKQDDGSGLPLAKPTRGVPEGYEDTEVRITIHTAVGLPRADYKSVLDVFIKLRCKTNKDKWVGDEVMWPVVSALEPVYNTTRLLGCNMLEVSTLEFRIWDKGIGQDEYVGDAACPLSLLTPGKQLQLPIRCKGKGAMLIVSLPSKPPMVKNVVMVRHGQSRWNAAKAAGGKTGVVDRLKETDHPLSVMGQEQATSLCMGIEDAIREGGEEGKLFEGIEKCYASPLTRAVQTALIGANPVIRKTGEKLTLTRYAREKRNVGGRDTNGAVKGAGIVKRVMQETDKLYDGVVPSTVDYDAIDHSRVDMKWWNDKAESKEEFLDRLSDLLNVIQWSPYKNIMIVGHSHCFRGFVSKYLSPTATLPPDITYSDLQHKKLCNCGAMHITLDFTKPTPIQYLSLLLNTTLVGGKTKVTESDDEQ